MKLRRTRRPHKFAILTRISGVIAVLVIIVGGTAYAALQSQQAKLTGNTIQTATANLQLSLDGNAYGATTPGFTFGAIVPGGPASPPDSYVVYLKNTGGTQLVLKLAVTSTPTNLGNIDLSKVHVLLTPTAGGSVQNFTLQTLISSAASGGQTILSPTVLSPGATVSYRIQVSMETDAVTGPGATINNIDFSFSGSTPT